MGNPAINGANKAQNSIEEQLKARMSGSATEANTAAPAAPSVDASAAPKADAKTNASGDGKKTPKYKFTDATSHLLGEISNTVTHHLQTIESSPLGRAMSEFGKKVRIVGYGCRNDARIDFKRVVSKPENENADRKFHFTLAMTPPSKPDRVIVKYPLDLAAKIDNLSSNITTKDVEEMKNLATNESAYNVQIFRIGKTDHTFFDWISQHCKENYINEAEEIFTPVTLIRGTGDKMKIDARENYVGEAAYARTGGLPGVIASLDIVSNDKAKVKVSGREETLIDITKDEGATLKVTYVNTGRPRWVAPGNYIVDKKYGTIPAVASQDPNEQVNLSLSYFGRWYDAKFEPSYKQELKDKGIKYHLDGAVKIEGKQAIDFKASPFTDASYFNNAAVEHWFDVVQENGRTVRRTLRGSEIMLVERHNKPNKDNTGKIYYTTTHPLTADGAPDSQYTWSEAVSDNIKKALGAAAELFTFELYKKSMIKPAGGNKASSRLTRNVNMPGQSFADIQQMFAKAKNALSGQSFGTTSQFGR